MSDKKLWQAVLGEMEVVLPEASFATWFKGTSLETTPEGTAYIHCPNSYSRDWLENKHKNQLLSILKKLNDKIHSIAFKSQGQKNLERLPLEIRAPAKASLEQLSPLLGFNPNYTFEKMVVANFNALAYAVAKEVALTPGKKHNPFFIYGGVGLGKTHLAQAIGHEIKKNEPKTKVVYVSCETFTNDFIAAIASKKMSEFKKNYREAGVLIVDDIQFLSAKEGSQEEFFHTFNTLHQHSRQIVLTADKTPQAIPALEGRLASRFGGGMVVDIQPPNLETRIAILTEKCKEKNYYLPDEVIEFMAKNISSNIRELEGALNRLITYCQFNQSSPTVSLAENVLKDAISSRNTMVDTAEIISAVCRHFSVSKDEITSNKRKKELIIPRQVAIYLIREQTNKSLSEIGKIMGGKDHTTILHSEKRINKLLKIDANLKSSIEQIRESVLAVK
jgi:chromosomal replication initiator protein